MNKLLSEREVLFTQTKEINRKIELCKRLYEYTNSDKSDLLGIAYEAAIMVIKESENKDGKA